MRSDTSAIMPGCLTSSITAGQRPCPTSGTPHAVSREAQTRFGLSISKIVKMLRPLPTATITLGGQQIEVPPRVPDEAQQRLLDDLKGGH